MDKTNQFTIQYKSNAISETLFNDINHIELVEIDKKSMLVRFRVSDNKMDDAAEIIQQLIAAMEVEGVEVLKEKEAYPILNMTCAACAASTQNILMFVPGVLDVSVNFANGKGTVTYLPGIATATDMKRALQEIGFDLLIDTESNTIENVEKRNEEAYRKLRRETISAIILATPLLVISMFFMNMPYANIIMFALATLILFIFGRRFFIGAYKQAKHRSANMDTLVALSTGIAYLFSVFNMVYPQFWESRGLDAHVFFEASGVIIAFILIGKSLESRAKGNTTQAIKKLMGLQPATVVLMRDGEPVEISIAEVQPGDIVLVKPGDRIAVDGEVTEGQSFVDESMLSGEPIHVEKKKGAPVFAGTINQKGGFQFKATKVGKDTLLAHIIKAVDEAQGSKAPVQALVDKIAGIFVPVVISIALVSFVIWFILGDDNGFVHGLMSMVTVLVIACPCALGLATPTAIMVGIGKGAEEGILIKDAESLESTKNIDVVVLDKTGTITEGKPQVNTMYWSSEATSRHRDILYSIEHSSEHPLAEAITAYLQKEARWLENISIQQVSGKGIEGIYENSRYLVGNIAFIRSRGISVSDKLQKHLDEELNASHTVAIFADEQEAYAVVGITDKMKPTSREAISKLQSKGIEVVIYTGDNKQVATALARSLNVKHVQGEVLPAEKADLVKMWQEKGKKVAMVGDGINDSAALAQADVSIAMGKGSDIAMDVAKMTIISSDLNKIPKAIRLSEETVRTIRQNLFWAFIYNIIGIPIAAGLLYPFTGFLLNPMIAGAAMALSSVSVVTNSLRLKSKKL